MPDPHYITVKSLSGNSPDQVRDARARAWAFVFDCYRKKEAASSPESRPDSDPDSEREKHRGGERCRSSTR